MNHAYINGILILNKWRYVHKDIKEISVITVNRDTLKIVMESAFNVVAVNCHFT